MLGKHRLGIYEKALDRDDSWERRLEKAAELGFVFSRSALTRASRGSAGSIGLQRRGESCLRQVSMRESL